MNKGLMITYLAVAFLSFTLGTMSTLNAAEGTAGKKDMGEINKKLDQVLQNQKNMRKVLKQIQYKV